MDQARTGYPYELGAEDPFALPPAVIPDCPLCSGKVSREDPTAQALAWGINSAEARVGTPGFWTATLALEHALNASAAGRGSDKMQEFLAQVQAVLGDGLQIIPVSEEGELSEKMRPVLEGQGLGSYDLWYEPVPVGELGDFSKPGPVSGTDCEAVDETEKGLLENEAFLEKIKGFRKYWIDKEGGGTWSPPTDSGDGGKPLCCVKKFLYPKPREEGDLERLTISDDIGVVPNDASKKTKEMARGHGAGRTVKVFWKAEAEYSDEGSCLCECCRFRQYILMDEMSWTFADKNSQRDFITKGDKDFPPHWEIGPPGEDCIWLVFDSNTGKYEEHYGRSDQKPEQPADAPDKPVLGPFCYGDEGQDTEIAKVTGGGFHQTFSKCKYEMVDTPAEWVPLGYWWDWNLIFLGVIHDRCNNWVPRRIKIFDASSRGLVESGSKSKITQKPKE